MSESRDGRESSSWMGDQRDPSFRGMSSSRISSGKWHVSTQRHTDNLEEPLLYILFPFSCLFVLIELIWLNHKLTLSLLSLPLFPIPLSTSSTRIRASPLWILRAAARPFVLCWTFRLAAIREYDAKQLLSYWLPRSPVPIPCKAESSVAPVKVAQVQWYVTLALLPLP